MKLVRKTLLGLTALAVVIGLASCKMGAGEGDTDGNKWNLTMTVDTTDSEKPMANGATYRRFWKQFSTSEKVAAIKTTVTIDPSACTLVPGSASVVGYIFDLNKNADDSNKVDFCLIGVNPQTAKFYTERYTGISKQNDELYDTTSNQLGPTGCNTDIGVGSYRRTNLNSWNTLTDEMYSTDTDGVITCKIEIKQQDKKYTVMLGSVKVAEYDASASTNVDTIDDVEYAVGGIACYGNAGTGVKIVANYTTDKSSVTGKLEAEEIEE